jgi:hypothetical protein
MQSSSGALGDKFRHVSEYQSVGLNTDRITRNADRQPVPIRKPADDIGETASKASDGTGGTHLKDG